MNLSLNNNITAVKQFLKNKVYKPYFQTNYYFKANLRSPQSTPLVPPIIITGIYRSGTTLTTSLVEKIGVDMGPENHKCRGSGELGNLNPEGFQENFLINDLGRYILHFAGGSGVRLPNEVKVCSIDLHSLSDADFAYYSEAELNDDRIAPKVRREVLRHYGVSRLNQYFCDYFDTSCWGFKDVHCGVYMPVYLKMWSGSKFVCVVREPSSFLKSALNLSGGASINTWVDYYHRAIQFEENAQIYWVIYESLLNREKEVIRGLIAFIKGQKPEQDDDIEPVMSLISKRKVNHKNESYGGIERASILYEKLKQKSVESMKRYLN
ncbi:MAG: sulfotransferase [Symploca sp. SIO2E9]|nr:sulfotransferase [Symploca sp. SIO2E9]